MPQQLNSLERCNERKMIIERELGADLSALSIDPAKLGTAEEKNCEQMFGHVPIPVGLAGPLRIQFSSGNETDAHLPLATTEAALIAGINRGCKALTSAGGAKVSSKYHGISRSLAFRIPDSGFRNYKESLAEQNDQWKQIGESTSNHLKIIDYHLDEPDDYLFLTINCDTDEAMGMNMVTIAAQAIGEWIQENIEGFEFITVAGNVDSDKKPSRRTHDLGRGYEVFAEAELSEAVIKDVLKSDLEALLKTAHAKLSIGSEVAGAIGSNLPFANVISALYLATGQDSAHVVEGSLADTTIELISDDKTSNQQRVNEKTLHVKVRCPAILVGVRGGGTQLPAQKQCLDLLLMSNVDCRMSNVKQLAETIGATVLAGEISLLAAQATHTLAKAHEKLGRN